jgi:hypothetical protein
MAAPRCDFTEAPVGLLRDPSRTSVRLPLAENSLLNERPGLHLCWGFRPGLRTAGRVARFGPTTTTRARRLSDSLRGNHPVSPAALALSGLLWMAIPGSARDPAWAREYPESARRKPTPGLIRSARSGPWSAAATWEGGKIPGSDARVQVRQRGQTPQPVLPGGARAARPGADERRDRDARCVRRLRRRDRPSQRWP